MTGLELSILAFLFMLLGIFLRVPISISMVVTGFIGTWIVRGTPMPVLHQLKSLTFETFSDYNLSVLPLFLLMGQFATHSGMSRDLFRAAADWIGHLRGGMAVAAVTSCAGFGAVCGSSLATASTMGQVALPELRRHGYSDRLSTGVLSAGGTLGILIPPSVILVIYALNTEQNIAKLFIAALIPGIMAAIGYALVVFVIAWLYPEMAPAGPKVPLRARTQNLLRVWPVVLIFLVVIGGIYKGIFTPTEGAAVGAVATAALGWFSGNLTRKGFVDSFLSTAVSTGMIYFILLGAKLFTAFMATTQTPQALATWVGTLDIAPMWIIVVMLLLYLAFGCIMDSLSMILLTIPIFFPIVSALDLGMTPEDTAIWFGILALIVVELGLITPPVGMNLFIISSIAKDVPATETYIGVAPFILAEIVRVGLLLAFPSITLWLVHLAF